MSETGPKPATCPYVHNLARFDQNPDDRTAEVECARERFLSDSHGGPQNIKHPALLLDDDYSVESILLNYLWEYVRKLQPLKEKIPKDENFWFRFIYEFQEFLAIAQRRFYESIRTNLENHLKDHPEGKPINSHELSSDLERFFLQHRDLDTARQIATSEDERIRTEAAGMPYGDNPLLLNDPAMTDLNNFVTRVFQVLDEKYFDTYGVKMTKEEFKRFARNPEFRKIFESWQINDRRSGEGLLNILKTHQRDALEKVRTAAEAIHPEGTVLVSGMDAFDVGVLLRPFGKNAFYIDRDGYKFGLKAEHMDRIRKGIGSITEPADGGTIEGANKQQRNCPIVYSRIFGEMYAWITDLVLYQLYDEPYVESSYDSPRLPAELRAKFREEIARVVLPHHDTIEVKPYGTPFGLPKVKEG